LKLDPLPTPSLSLKLRPTTTMMIVGGQIHLWASGTPSAHNRQTPYSKDQALADMAAAGLDRAAVHPVMWDPDSNELAVEAARQHPDHFAILGWFYLDRPESRNLIVTWKSRPGMLGLRFYFTEPRMQSWPRTARWTGCGRLPSVPVCQSPRRRVVSAGSTTDRRTSSWSSADRRPHGRSACGQGRTGVLKSATAFGAGETSKCRDEGHRSGRLCRGRLSVPQPARAPAPGVRRAWAINGCPWGTEITRMHCSSRQCATLFTEELPGLKEQDLELVMGRALWGWIGWDIPN
jgi:hypothetical protein